MGSRVSCDCGRMAPFKGFRPESRRNTESSRRGACWRGLQGPPLADLVFQLPPDMRDDQWRHQDRCGIHLGTLLHIGGRVHLPWCFEPRAEVEVKLFEKQCPYLIRYSETVGWVPPPAPSRSTDWCEIPTGSDGVLVLGLYLAGGKVRGAHLGPEVSPGKLIFHPASPTLETSTSRRDHYTLSRLPWPTLLPAVCPLCNMCSHTHNTLWIEKGKNPEYSRIQ